MTDYSETLKNDFENSFEKSLRSLGYLFPTTEDEVNAFEEQNKIEKVPNSFNSSSELISKSKHSKFNKKLKISANKSSENLARAARKGNDIPDAYHAALAMEWGCVSITTDKGFKRFKGLKSKHPFDLPA